jgi:hypothetical protein
VGLVVVVGSSQGALSENLAAETYLAANLGTYLLHNLGLHLLLSLDSCLVLNLGHIHNLHFVYMGSLAVA